MYWWPLFIAGWIACGIGTAFMWKYMGITQHSAPSTITIGGLLISILLGVPGAIIIGFCFIVNLNFWNRRIF